MILGLQLLLEHLLLYLFAHQSPKVTKAPGANTSCTFGVFFFANLGISWSAISELSCCGSAKPITTHPSTFWLKTTLLLSPLLSLWVYIIGFLKSLYYKVLSGLGRPTIKSTYKKFIFSPVFLSIQDYFKSCNGSTKHSVVSH